MPVAAATMDSRVRGNDAGAWGGAGSHTQAVTFPPLDGVAAPGAVGWGDDPWHAKHPPTPAAFRRGPTRLRW
jgi:hypothetical protein